MELWRAEEPVSASARGMSMADAPPKGADLGPWLPSDSNQQLVLITVLTLVCVLFGRYLANTVGNGQTPPVFEGLPFIGGLLKFTKVRLACTCECMSESTELERERGGE